MDYSESMEFIYNTAKFGMNFGLKRINRLLDYMGHPEKNLKCIHVAGTNGKGSVTSIISRILIEEGYKVGIYTSPYLQRFSERIKINNDEITQAKIAELITYIKPLIEKVIGEGFDHPTEFEIITAMMFKYFDDMHVDLAVVEVGLGGRLDSTNVINPLVSVITTISYDHMAVLGDTIGKIAYEKAGIIKENGTVVVYPQIEEAYQVIKKVCGQKNAELLRVEDSGIFLKDYSIDGQKFDIDLLDKKYNNLSLSLLGEHQLLNVKTSITAVRALARKGINVSDDSIYRGIKKVRWPGRLEVFSKDPIIVLDGAHNIQGMDSLKQALEKYFSYTKLILVIGILKDKQVKEMCDIIMPFADYIITTTPASERAMPADELAGYADLYGKKIITSPDINDAFNNGINLVNKGDMLLFCGSLYMIGNVRSLLEELYSAKHSVD